MANMRGALTLRGSRVVEVSTLDALADAPCAIICNPNNPDGRRFDADTLLELARKRTGNGLLVVDESFADLEGEGLSLAPHLPQPGLLVLRSLSKSYGLGGVRLGFALADPDACRIDPRRARTLAGLGACDRDRISPRLPIAPGSKPRSSGLRRTSHDSMGCCARPA